MTDTRDRDTIQAPHLPEDDFPNGPEAEPKTGRHNERPVFLGNPPPVKIPGAEPIPPELFATVIRSVLKEELAPIETKLDDVKQISTTTSDGVVELNTKVAQLTDDRAKDRRDIDRILSHLRLPAAE